MCGQLHVLKGMGYITPVGYVSVLLTIRRVELYRVQIGGVFGTPNHHILI